MRLPLIRFGSDDRPVEPWEERLAPVGLFMVPLLFAILMLMAAIAVALLLGWAAVAPVLPRSWRLNWDTAFDLDPSVLADCPVCHAHLSLGPVDKRGCIFEADQGRQVVMPTQSATCPQCRRAFRRLALGKIWSGWQEVQTGV